jgi:hypothetical protein
MVSPNDVSNLPFVDLFFLCIYLCSYTLFLLGTIEEIRRLRH